MATATDSTDADALADQDAADAAADSSADAGRKSYDEGYVKRLRDESRKRIERAQTAERERDELKAKVDAAERAELEKKGELQKLLDKEREDAKKRESEFVEKVSASERRFILAEAKAAAIRAGIIDPSDVKTALDVKDLRVNDDGDVEGLDEQIEALKAKKPHWFKASKSADADSAGDADKADKSADRKRLAAPPARKDGAATDSLDFSKASDADFRKTLAQYGVTA